MSNNLEYNGRPNFSRPRNLSEASNSSIAEQLQNLKINENDERQEVVDKIFTNIAKTFLKGDKLLTGLRNMEPAQFILIEPDASEVSASARRYDIEQSQRGTVITYSMYTRAIDSILEHQWESRLSYTSIKVPASLTSQSKQTSTSSSGSNFNLISEFLSQNGIAGTILGMLTLSPFQNLIFQSLTVEEGAKGVQTAQIVPGIALLLEFGIKAQEIYKLLKSAKISSPLVESEVNRLSSDDNARAEALNSIGLDSNSLKGATKVSDSQIIINYVSDFYKRYGGLSEPNGHLTIDHWIAYANVARNQQTIRGCLNTAESFSPQFNEIRKDFDPIPTTEFVNTSTSVSRTSKITVQLASAVRSLNAKSDEMYDDILDSMQYQLTDRDLCCLVEIFGANYDTRLMRTLASILRILSIDLAGAIVRIDDLVKRLLSSLLQDALFQVASQFNELYYKVVEKLTKMFTLKIDGLENCGGLLTIGLALIQSVRVIFEQLEALIAEISALIGNYGESGFSKWTVTADRRHLMGIAKVLETLASRLDAARACDKKNSSSPNYIQSISDVDTDGSAVLAIIEKSDPIINIPIKDLETYFDNRKPRVSDTLRFSYGIKNVQNTSNTTTSTNCSDDTSKSMQNLIQGLKEALSTIDE